MCGGLGYINIFHTDAHTTTIHDWGCGNTAQDTYYQKWYDDMGHCGTTPDTTEGTRGTTQSTTPMTTLPATTPGQSEMRLENNCIWTEKQMTNVTFSYQRTFLEMMIATMTF